MVEEENSSVDTSNEWWHRPQHNNEAQPSIVERAKQVGVIGLTGALLLGNSLMLGQEVLHQNMGDTSPMEGNETIQNLVIEQPKELQGKFIERDTHVILNQDVVTSNIQVENAPSSGNISETKDQVEIQLQKTNETSERWWHEVPEYSQQGLKYELADTKYGCVPTSTSMVLEYWQ
jgi:hypothetical protein